MTNQRTPNPTSSSQLLSQSMGTIGSSARPPTPMPRVPAMITSATLDSNDSEDELHLEAPAYNNAMGLLARATGVTVALPSTNILVGNPSADVQVAVNPERQAQRERNQEEEFAAAEDAFGSEEDMIIEPLALGSVGVENHRPAGYPPPETVLADPIAAAQLNSSGLLQELSIVPFNMAIRIGTTDVRTGVGHSILSPYECLLVKVASCYYSTLPPIGYSLDVFQTLHYLLKVSTRNGPHLSTPSIQERYGDIHDLGLTELCLGLARVMIPPESLHSDDLLEAFAASSCHSAVDEIKANWKDLYTLYSVLGHLIHGGANCIEPIPVLLRFDPRLDAYICKIAQDGSTQLQHLILSMSPRSPTLQVASFQSPVIPQVVTPEPQPTADQPAPVEDESIRPLFEFGSTSRQQQINRPRNRALLNSGDPGRFQVIRDTSNFVSQVEINRTVQAQITSLVENSQSNMSKLDVIMQSLSQLQANVTNIESTLAVMISQMSTLNLTDRSNYNRTVLTVDHPEAVQIVNTTAVPSTLNVSSLDQVVTDLQRFPSPDLPIRELTARIRSLLSAGNHDNLLSLVNEGAITADRSRARLIQRLRTLPRSG